jgi:hypothetical protein
MSRDQQRGSGLFAAAGLHPGHSALSTGRPEVPRANVDRGKSRVETTNSSSLSS